MSYRDIVNSLEFTSTVEILSALKGHKLETELRNEES